MTHKYIADRIFISVTVCYISSVTWFVYNVYTKRNNIFRTVDGFTL